MVDGGRAFNRWIPKTAVHGTLTPRVARGTAATVTDMASKAIITTMKDVVRAPRLQAGQRQQAYLSRERARPGGDDRHNKARLLFGQKQLLQPLLATSNSLDWSMFQPWFWLLRRFFVFRSLNKYAIIMLSCCSIYVTTLVRVTYLINVLAWLEHYLEYLGSWDFFEQLYSLILGGVLENGSW